MCDMTKFKGEVEGIKFPSSDRHGLKLKKKRRTRFQELLFSSVLKSGKTCKVQEIWVELQGRVPALLQCDCLSSNIHEGPGAPPDQTQPFLPWCFPSWRHDHKHINKSYSVINNRCRIKSVDKLHQVSGLYAFSTTSKSHCSRKLPRQLFSLKSCSLGKHPLSFHALTGEIDTDSLEAALGEENLLYNANYLSQNIS